LIKDLDPEAAQGLLDPAIYIMMHAVHRYEGTVNQILGDGIMALFGAPLAHEDHALRACYAALAMQAAMRDYTEKVRRTHGMALRIRVGLNAGEVVVRAIGSDLHMDYSAVGQTTHLAADGATRRSWHHRADRYHPALDRRPRPGARRGAGAGQGHDGAGGGVRTDGSQCHLTFWHKAGQKASECSAYVEAMAHLRRGLEVLQTRPETTERAQ
jgi:hypothetical protein